MRKLESVPGIVSVHDLRIWRLSQKDCVASAHIVMNPLQKTISSQSSEVTTPFHCVSADSFAVPDAVSISTNEPIPSDLVLSGTETFNERLKRVKEAFDAFGIPNVTLQIEEHGQTCCAIDAEMAADTGVHTDGSSTRTRHADQYSIVTGNSSGSRIDIRPQE